MKFEFVPTLEKLRDLYTVPRGPQRFQAYIDLTVGGAQRSIDLALPPLVMANPMAKENVLELVKTWIELGAEDAAAAALEQAQTLLETTQLELDLFSDPIKVGFTVLDDLGGGWTNRTFNDAARFKTAENLHKTHWIILILWSSETPAQGRIRPLVLESVYRAGYATQHGDPQTLRQMMHQEGHAAHFAGQIPIFDPEELEYSRSVITPHLEATEQPITFACMYGDDAARAIGYAPLGLSPNAGFAVALADVLTDELERQR
jgi:hypothetical protein